MLATIAAGAQCGRKERKIPRSDTDEMKRDTPHVSDANGSRGVKLEWVCVGLARVSRADTMGRLSGAQLSNTMFPGSFVTRAP
jgi:hypothetical protein